MTPTAIIREAAADGVRLALSPAGTIKAAGDAAAVHRWLPVIREFKPGILAALSPIAPDLEHLIVRAGAFWEYSHDDYVLIREVARRDPDGLRLALENDVAFSRRELTS
ncbi:MAG: hypothetical protein Q8Q28_15440 [Pseudomonadota bacterium]|nr:hypothetical protein [Pseudomonadota bacterium]